MNVLTGEDPRKCWIANAERLARLGHFARYSKKQRTDVLRKGYLGLWAPDQGIKAARGEADLGYAFWTPNYIDDMRDFMVVGGEWFAMWQSRIWNGEEGAFRFYLTILAVLIFVNQRDDGLD